MWTDHLAPGAEKLDQVLFELGSVDRLTAPGVGARAVALRRRGGILHARVWPIVDEERARVEELGRIHPAPRQICAQPSRIVDIPEGDEVRDAGAGQPLAGGDARGFVVVDADQERLITRVV